MAKKLNRLISLTQKVDQLANDSIIYAKLSINGTLVNSDYAWLKRLIETNPLIMLGRQWPLCGFGGPDQKIYLDLTFNGLRLIDLSWLDFCLFECSLQVIDLRSNLIKSILYNGMEPTIPITLRLSRNPLRLSESLAKVKKTFIIDDGNSITISDDYGTIPFRFWI